MQAFRRRRPANQNAVAANNTRQPAVIATTSVSTGSEPLGEPETGEQRGAMAVLLAGTYLLILTYFRKQVQGLLVFPLPAQRHAWSDAVCSRSGARAWWM